MPRLRIFKSELSLIADEILRHPRTETGGQLIGLWTHGGAPVVYAATRPGRNCVREPHHFRQAPATHRRIEAHMWRQYGLQCVGIWHSHHGLPLTQLSRGDLERTQRYARRHNRPKFTEILGWIRNGEAQLRPYVFTDAKRLSAPAAELEVLPGKSPLRSAPIPPELSDALLPEGETDSWTLHRSDPLQPGKAGKEGPIPVVRGLRPLEDWIERSIPEELRGGIGLETLSEGFLLQVSSPRLARPVFLRIGGGGSPGLEAAWTLDARGRKRTLQLREGAEAILRKELAGKSRRKGR